jgi:hypothetical protein
MKGGQHENNTDLDWMQLVLLAICVFDMVFFSYYLFTYELDMQNTISDTLFIRIEYVTVLTITLACRMLGAYFFLTQYRFLHRAWMVAGYVGIFLTMAGW